MSVFQMVTTEQGIAKGLEPKNWSYLGTPDPIYLEETYRGCVIGTGERNHYDDSDFTVTVWDEALQVVRTFEYASTRYWSYADHCEADITPENMAKAEAWNIKRWEASLTLYAQDQARKVEKGKTVKVIKGRKLPKGTTGIVGWCGETRYGWSVRIDHAGAREFTSLDNVEVVNPDQYLPTAEEIAYRANCRRHDFGFYLPAGLFH